MVTIVTMVTNKYLRPFSILAEYQRMPRLTVELLCRCTGHATKRRRDENQEQFLSRITHLYCSEKGIEKIESLHLCRSLLVLYLYDNKINCIECLDHTPLLTHLYLQNNCVQKLENLHHLQKLTKLYLSHNSIRVLEGLEELTQLTELHIAYQSLPTGEKLLVDPRSIKAISNTLVVLNVSGNSLDTLEDFLLLQELQQLSASDNDLQKMKKLSKVLSRLPKLWKLDLLGNPLTSQHKYRDRVVTMCYRLEMLDGREVSEMERQFLFSWKAMRKARQRHQQQILSGELQINLTSHQPPPSSLPSLPPPTQSIPALPARTPIRLQQQIQQKKRQQMNRMAATERPNPTHLHLPSISTSGRTNMIASSQYYYNPHELSGFGYEAYDKMKIIDRLMEKASALQ